MDLIMFGMVIKTGPKFYVVLSPTQFMTKVKITDLEVLCKSFVLNFLQFQFFAKPSMDFIHVWHDDRTFSEILCGAIPIPVHDLTVKVTDFEFLCYIFTMSVFAKPLMDMIHVWHEWT